MESGAELCLPYERRLCLPLECAMRTRTKWIALALGCVVGPVAWATWFWCCGGQMYDGLGVRFLAPAGMHVADEGNAKTFYLDHGEALVISMEPAELMSPSEAAGDGWTSRTIGGDPAYLRTWDGLARWGGRVLTWEVILPNVAIEIDCIVADGMP